MKRTTSTVTLLPFAPHQQQHSSTWSSQHSTSRSRIPSLLGASVPCMMTAPSPSQIFDVSRRPNPLRIRPSIISEASCESSSSSSSSFSSSSSSSSSYPSTSPTSCSTSPTLSPSPPPPSNRSPGKSRPLPQPPAPVERFPFTTNAAAAGQFRPRTPPPAWSPPETESSLLAARPTRPTVLLPPGHQERHPPASSSPPFTQPDGHVSLPSQPRVRPLPTRPVPPGPPSENNTPIAPFGLPRWHADTLTLPQDDTSMSPSVDRRAIDWDLIDEVMKHAS